MTRIIRIAVFPLALVAAIASAMTAMDRGFAPVLAMFGVYVTGMLALASVVAEFFDYWAHRMYEVLAD